MNRLPDIDVDVADRDAALQGLDYVSASLLIDEDLRRHNTGVFFQRIPVDPITGLAAFPSGKKSEDVSGQLGYFKMDILPNHAYRLVRDRDHLETLFNSPVDWSLFLRDDVVRRLYHLGKWFEVVDAYEPKSLHDLACVIAIIRPAKKYLLGLPLDQIQDELWRPDPDGYYFKKAHAFAFAGCIVVQLNSMVEAGEIMLQRDEVW
jgi:hypothetical protein